MDDEWKVRQTELADVPAIVALSDALFREDSGQRDPLMNHADCLCRKSRRPVLLRAAGLRVPHRYARAAPRVGAVRLPEHP
jgi:hypothetical protein